MKGREYSNLIATYLTVVYGDRGLKVYCEVPLGKSIIGKRRRVDVFAVHQRTDTALAIECKFQGSTGTVDEKIPYTLQDLAAMRIQGLLVYAGAGFSAGVRYMLDASPMAAFCLPQEPPTGPSAATSELDHVVAMTFGWWELVLKGRQPVRVD